jgi:hypothetical protein
MAIELIGYFARGQSCISQKIADTTFVIDLFKLPCVFVSPLRHYRQFGTTVFKTTQLRMETLRLP